MSIDKKVTKNLIEVLEDGREGFDHAAERLRDSDRADLTARFETFSAQRAAMSEELDTMAAAYGDDIDEDGSIAAAAHRAWMTLRDTIAGADPSGVLNAAVKGEDHAVKEFTDALEKDISHDLRTVVERQLADIETTHADVVALAQAESN